MADGSKSTDNQMPGGKKKVSSVTPKGGKRRTGLPNTNTSAVAK
jgi:hypothetical protein